MVAGVPLHGDVQRLATLVVLVLEVADLGEQGLLGGVEVTHEVHHAALVLVGDGLFLAGPLVDEDDLQPTVEEGHRLQALQHGAGHELRALAGEDGGVRPELHGGAGGAAALRRAADDGHLPLRLATLGVLLLVSLAVAVHREQQALAERVDDADAHAVQAAGHLVALAAELAAGVQHGEHDLRRALALVRTGRVGVHRDAAAVVVHAAATVGQHGDRDGGGEARHGLVHRVVHDLPDEVVEAGEAGGTDIHARSFADRIQPLEHLDVLGAVVGARLLGVSSHCYLNRVRGKQAVTCGFLGDGGGRALLATAAIATDHSLPEGCARVAEPGEVSATPKNRRSWVARRASGAGIARIPLQSSPRIGNGEIQPQNGPISRGISMAAPPRPRWR